MGNLLFYSSNVWIYLVLTLLLLYGLIKYSKPFSIDSLIDSLIYLTNKVSMFFLFITFSFAFMFSLLDFTNTQLNYFLQDVFNGFLFYWFFNYAVFYGIKAIYWFKDFYKETDLFAYSLFEDKIKEMFKK